MSNECVRVQVQVQVQQTLPVQSHSALDPPQLRGRQEGAPEGISSADPAPDPSRTHSRCNAKISGVAANVSTSATHQRDALPVPEIASVHGRAAYPRTAEEEAP